MRLQYVKHNPSYVQNIQAHMCSISTGWEEGTHERSSGVKSGHLGTICEQVYLPLSNQSSMNKKSFKFRASLDTQLRLSLCASDMRSDYVLPWRMSFPHCGDGDVSKCRILPTRTSTHPGVTHESWLGCEMNVWVKIPCWVFCPLNLFLGLWASSIRI